MVQPNLFWVLCLGVMLSPVSSQGGPAVHSKDGYHPWIWVPVQYMLMKGRETIVHFVLLEWQKTLTIGCCLVETNSWSFELWSTKAIRLTKWRCIHSTVTKLTSNHVVVKGDFHIFAHKTGTQQTSLEMPKWTCHSAIPTLEHLGCHPINRKHPQHKLLFCWGGKAHTGLIHPACIEYYELWDNPHKHILSTLLVMVLPLMAPHGSAAIHVSFMSCTRTVIHYVWCLSLVWLPLPL